MQLYCLLWCVMLQMRSVRGKTHVLLNFLDLGREIPARDFTVIYPLASLHISLVVNPTGWPLQLDWVSEVAGILCFGLHPVSRKAAEPRENIDRWKDI
ncbi:hypothetical protein LZ30DRAFT_718890 [Colletotrichum cereale]|nr:hypothetical protein LZ30DRAFT_718890 [Colletotrichum cereale]